jgi:hypothetical protein
LELGGDKVIDKMDAAAGEHEKARSLRSIAKSARVRERYVSQVVHCAFLAPD